MSTGQRVANRLPDGRSAPVAAAYGAAVTVVLSVLPFSPVLGGAVAALRYDRGSYVAGFALGLLAGIGAAIPLALFVIPAVWIVGLLGVGVGPGSPGYGVFLALIALLFLAYAVGFSALGGLGGVWARRNTDWDLESSRWL